MELFLLRNVARFMNVLTSLLSLVYFYCWYTLTEAYGGPAFFGAGLFLLVVLTLSNFWAINYLREPADRRTLSQEWENQKWWMRYRWFVLKLWVRANYQARKRGFSLPTVRHMEPIPPGANPFNHDLSNMGSSLTRGWIVMHEGFDSEENPLPLHYVILINTRTGQRIRVTNLEKCS